MLTIVLALLAAASNAAASVLQRKANLKEIEADRSGLAGLVDLLRQPLWLAGIGAVIASFLLQAAALDTGELSEVQPLMSLELPITLLLASVAFGQHLPGRTWVEILVMSGGMALFLFSLHPSAGQRSPGGEAWAWGTGITAAVVLVVVTAGFLQRGSRRAALLGVGAGMSFALTATFMSGTLGSGLSWSLLTRWQTYLVGVAGLTAMLLLQEALQAGSLVVVQPGLTLVDPVVAIGLGAALFGESLRGGGWLVGEVAGALAVGWAAVRMARSPVADPSRDPEPGTDGQSGEPAAADAAEGR
jgi:drug/metabolite transporter (DMT)-like permease